MGVGESYNKNSGNAVLIGEEVKAELYQNGVKLMSRKHFYPVRTNLIKLLNIKNIYIPFSTLEKIARENGYKIKITIKEVENGNQNLGKIPKN